MECFRMLYSDRRLDFIPCLEQRKPNTAKKAGIGAIVGVVLSILFYVIIFVIGIGSASMGYYY